MNPLLQCKPIILPLLIAGVLACFGLLPKAQAVVPAPDGGYPGFNTAEGQNALFSLTTGSANTAVGWFSLSSNAEGNFNTATGAGALLFNTADNNTAIGAAALLFNTTGTSNTANGVSALSNNTAGFTNTATGRSALISNTTGNGNTGVGFEVLEDNTTGAFNTAVGRFALAENTTGHRNIALGFNSGGGVTTASNVICIGADVDGANDDDRCFIGNIWEQPGGTQAVYVNSNGRLGEIVSSRRFKDNIKPIEEVSEVIYNLKPVRFRYKAEIEPTRPLGFGLIAEEVAEVAPNLVTYDAKGQLSTVRYDAVNAMLLNEFLKEHQKVQELEATVARLKSSAGKQEAAIAQQQKQIEALTAGLQKVSAQLELSKGAPQTVLNNQ